MIKKKKENRDDSSVEIKSFIPKKCFYKKWVFFLSLKADGVIFGAFLFWVIYSISVESDSFRLEPITFYFRSWAWYPLMCLQPWEEFSLDHSTFHTGPFASLPSSQLLTCLSEDPRCLGRAYGNSARCKQPWLSTSMTFTVQESTHRPPSSPNLSSPLRSLYSFCRSPPERLFFPKTLQLCVLYWKKAMGFISEPWKQTSHSTLSVFLEASTNTSLLEDKKCKTCIHLFSRLKPTGNSYEPWTIAPASRIKGYLNEILHEVKTRRTEGKS